VQISGACVDGIRVYGIFSMQIAAIQYNIRLIKVGKTQLKTRHNKKAYISCLPGKVTKFISKANSNSDKIKTKIRSRHDTSLVLYV